MKNCFFKKKIAAKTFFLILVFRYSDDENYLDHDGEDTQQLNKWNKKINVMFSNLFILLIF